jgi:sugar/nucleoside kinase (ribokinase family)
MAIYTLGSINIDHVYQVPHLAKPGETLAATSYTKGLGGKGANQSVAASKAGAKVFLIGAIGPDSTWVLDELNSYRSRHHSGRPRCRKQHHPLPRRQSPNHRRPRHPRLGLGPPE